MTCEPSGISHLRARAINFYCSTNLKKVTVPWDLSSLPDHLTSPKCSVIQECGGRLFLCLWPLVYLWVPMNPKNYVSRYFIVCPPPPPQVCFHLYFSHQKRHSPAISSQRLEKHGIFLFLLFMLLLQRQADPAKCALGAKVLPWPLPGNLKVPVSSSRSQYCARPLSLSHLNITSLKAEYSLIRTQSWKDAS